MLKHELECTSAGLIAEEEKVRAVTLAIEKALKRIWEIKRPEGTSSLLGK